MLDSELDVAGVDAVLLLLLGGVAGEFDDFCHEVPNENRGFGEEKLQRLMTL